MDITQTRTDGRPEALRNAVAGWLYAAYAHERAAAIAMASTIAVALALVAVLTPIVGRGDYGQWLMTSRYYLGQQVPEYRAVSALPPLVPVLLAGLRLALPDAVTALHMVDALLLMAFAGSFFFAGSALLRSSIGGAVTVAAAVLITDRFVELSAFGGLLQLVAVSWLNVSLGALVRAGDEGRARWRWWALAGVALVLLSLSHVGTATVGIPVSMAFAISALLRRRNIGWRALLQSATPFAAATAAIALYALLFLLPASRDYVTNPASLGYRGPDRLLSGLFAYWPTAATIVVGAASLLVGAAAGLFGRAREHWALMLLWAVITWGSFAVSAAQHASTDYPRFATLVMAPLTVGVAAVLLRVASSIERYLQSQVGALVQPQRVVAGAWLIILVAAPFAVIRYQNLVSTYQPLDANGLTAAVAETEASLGAAPGTVLTSVRVGKWLEGVTGHPALFSQPVRYAFRPDEWQRSVDADALMRSTAALTNQFFFLKFSDRAEGGAGSSVTGLTIAINHRGEFVDLLQVAHGSAQLVGDGATLTAETGPAGTSASQTQDTATLRTQWRQASGSVTAAFQRTVTLTNGGSTLAIADSSPGYRLRTELRVPQGMAITSLTIDGQEAQMCMTLIGDRPPCVRIWVAQKDATLSATSRGIELSTSSSSLLQYYVTDLTPGGVSSRLRVIDPAELVTEYNVTAAILERTDPAFEGRKARLEALGFRELTPTGTYAAFVLADPPGQARLDALP